MTDKEKIVKANCSFCGKEIECPLEMIDKVEKHSCFECFTNFGNKFSEEEVSKIHVDMPKTELNEKVAKYAVDKMPEEIFPKLWSENKSELKEMSKKELAREMFAEGAFMAWQRFIDILSDEHENDNGDETK